MTVKEMDMYEPLKVYLEQEGYRVRGEVKDADIVAINGDEMIIVEMKTSFNLKLVYQLIERQRLTDNVYAAVAVDYKTRRNKAFYNMQKLLKRLSVGLIVVHKKRDGLTVEKLFDPEFFRYNRSHIKEKQIRYEFQERVTDHNTGGVTREKLVTAYRQKALKIAYLLECEGSLSVKEIRTQTGIEKASSILQKNHYGWFVRIKRGTYELSDCALSEMRAFESAYEELKNQ